MAGPSPSVTRWEPPAHDLSPPSGTRCAGAARATGWRPCASGWGRESPRSGSRSSSSRLRRGDLLGATVLGPKFPDVDVGRLDADRRQDGADLAAVIGPVVQRLRKTNAGGRLVRRPIRPTPHDETIGIVELCDDARPFRSIFNHDGANVSERLGLIVHAFHPPPGQEGEIAPIAGDEVAECLEN